jgi:hypothetical protein
MRQQLSCLRSQFGPHNRNEASIATDQHSSLTEATILCEDAPGAGTTGIAGTVLT